MENSIIDEGLIEVILEKLEKQRLPRLLALKDKVDGGRSLEDFDLDFLEISIADAKKRYHLSAGTRSIRFLPRMSCVFLKLFRQRRWK